MTPEPNDEWRLAGLVTGGVDDDVATIAIRLPETMLDELRAIAQGRGCTVSEHIRRCVSLDRALFEDPHNTLTLHRTDGTEAAVSLDPNGWIRHG